MENTYRITAIEPQKKKKDRYNVFVDGEYICALSAESCVKFDIKAGREIAVEALNSAVLSDNTQYAFDSAISLLSFKMRTRAELTEKLTARKINMQSIEEAIEKLAKYGYVNDTQYAQEFVQSAISSERYGRKVIAFKLKEKGIDETIIEDVMQTFSHEIETLIARKQLLIFKKKYLNEDKYKKRKKIYAALARRGFDYDIINTILYEEEE
jgi:regulatory protein